MLYIFLIGSALAYHDTVPSTTTNLDIPACTAAVDRMKKGPAYWNVTNQYTDRNFYMEQTLWDKDLDDYKSYYETEYYLDNDIYPSYKLSFKRIKDVYPKASIFGRGGVEYEDVIQGGAGTCYIMAATAAVAEYPDIIKRVFMPK